MQQKICPNCRRSWPVAVTMCDCGRLFSNHPSRQQPDRTQMVGAPQLATSPPPAVPTPAPSRPSWLLYLLAAIGAVTVALFILGFLAVHSGTSARWTAGDIDSRVRWNMSAADVRQAVGDPDDEQSLRDATDRQVNWYYNTSDGHRVQVVMTDWGGGARVQSVNSY